MSDIRVDYLFKISNTEDVDTVKKMLDNANIKYDSYTDGYEAYLHETITSLIYSMASSEGLADDIDAECSAVLAMNLHDQQKEYIKATDELISTVQDTLSDRL